MTPQKHIKNAKKVIKKFFFNAFFVYKKLIILSLNCGYLLYFIRVKRHCASNSLTNIVCLC